MRSLRRWSSPGQTGGEFMEWADEALKRENEEWEHVRSMCLNGTDGVEPSLNNPPTRTLSLSLSLPLSPSLPLPSLSLSPLSSPLSLAHSWQSRSPNVM